MGELRTFRDIIETTWIKINILHIQTNNNKASINGIIEVKPCSI